MANTRKHGRLWDIYRYYKDKKCFGNSDDKQGADFSLVDNFNILDNDNNLDINKDIK